MLKWMCLATMGPYQKLVNSYHLQICQLCCAEKEVLAALGEDPERAPWKSWASLREQVIERQLAKQFTPTAFVQNRVSHSATECSLTQGHKVVQHI